MGEWEEVPLGSLTTIKPTYGVVKPGLEGGIPLVRATDLRDGRVQIHQLRTIEEMLHQQFRRTHLQYEDLLIGLVGSPGEVALVPELLVGANVNRAVGILRFDRSRLLPEFALAYMRGPGRARLLQDVVGSVQQVVNLRDLAAMEIPVPPLPEQRAIAGVLGALDDKIESNRRLAEAARQTLMSQVPSEGDEVPLSGTGDFVNGGALTKLATGSGRPILRIKELRGGVTDDTPRTDAAVRDIHDVEDGDLLFSWSGTLLTTRWDSEPSVLNQHVFRVRPRVGIPTWLLEAWIEQWLPEFRQIAADKATTMGHIQRHHLDEAIVRVPGSAQLAELAQRCDPMDDLRMTLLRESRTLTALRDALLPKLVSGKIRVPISGDVEEQVGAAGEALAS